MLYTCCILWRHKDVPFQAAHWPPYFTPKQAETSAHFGVAQSNCERQTNWPQSRAGQRKRHIAGVWYERSLTSPAVLWVDKWPLRHNVSVCLWALGGAVAALAHLPDFPVLQQSLHLLTYTLTLLCGNNVHSSELFLLIAENSHFLPPLCLPCCCSSFLIFFCTRFCMAVYSWEQICISHP